MSLEIVDIPLKRKIKGFTLMELMVTLIIVGVLAAIALPAYQNYTRRAYYSEVVNAAAPYRFAVGECAHNLGTVTGCNAGSNFIQSAITAPVGAVNSLSVADGVITITPVAQNGITATDTYVLTPTVNANGTVTWASSGGAVTNGYTK